MRFKTVKFPILLYQRSLLCAKTSNTGSKDGTAINYVKTTKTFTLPAYAITFYYVSEFRRRNT